MAQKRNLDRLKENKNLLFYDTYERHRKIASFIKSRETVLDVGGELNLLSKFCNPKKIVVANIARSIEESDVIIKKDKLPFASNSFDTVCAIDVLEHLPKNDRSKFIKNLLAVASKKVIISFPVGTIRHNQYEKETRDWLLNLGEDITYLNEHIKYSLPTVSEIQTIMHGFHARLFYSGNIMINKLLFRFLMFDPKIKFLRKIIYCLKLIFNFVTNPLLYLFLSNKGFSDSVNRAYLVVEKGKK
ncbi:hypothetical protein A2697_01145 [Candidatus Curtissbacteria bacterium RIFCSPHIGHO2_01_FULL_41_44]|uniref:Methyltransferase type 11 domain-containing protein n=1 Tax=Candidatus Curtissbacteria bacterium RIFCSPLOWO2_01_FULL_42_50 TaxID=1797730 RepID=A0A1F5H302_9BACT|nr:MAG: hypothetical protein A3C33_02445 [Candidatus Curtissbacteria bacterium RIFCSPHIGHO2_02_FULL_42_58]OGD94854.1 MAG: hypothetical protein A2697_01145 [Candidatus Curtissbacteria bacterium RIFCSPHIGHO2_01_FULL_41_44]OGD96455.1 MAG: hypothetical protein A3E71_02585 [Candidatus Curtissbacteria bacterium RIFCSPHIGHO2_12_FULL_42_33]OGD98481.1 MAG: hypothetical protein A3B54_04425 [Candidatus Curtissbacteria bacterium RIFCSPLOWO2_01_FULL_42_50]OGE02711.1 MAG: hypothetical protein A3G16_01910 [Ca